MQIKSLKKNLKLRSEVNEILHREIRLKIKKIVIINMPHRINLKAVFKTHF